MVLKRDLTNPEKTILEEKGLPRFHRGYGVSYAYQNSRNIDGGG